jgi:hypothetical protein
MSRARLAGGYVDILLADGDVAAARSAADELGTVASTLGRPLPTALHLQVLGAVQLAEDQPDPPCPLFGRHWPGGASSTRRTRPPARGC